MGMLKDIVIDCRHAPTLARFWAGLLDGYAVRAYDEAEIARLAAQGLTPESDPNVAVDGPGPTLFFQEVPGPKAAKNRLHLDIEVADRVAEVERLTANGAKAIAGFDTWTVLRDPEGNEFCLTDPH
jgi:hypothetical protein